MHTGMLTNEIWGLFMGRRVSGWARDAVLSTRWTSDTRRARSKYALLVWNTQQRWSNTSSAPAQAVPRCNASVVLVLGVQHATYLWCLYASSISSNNCRIHARRRLLTSNNCMPPNKRPPMCRLYLRIKEKINAAGTHTQRRGEPIQSQYNNRAIRVWYHFVDNADPVVVDNSSNIAVHIVLYLNFSSSG